MPSVKFLSILLLKINGSADKTSIPETFVFISFPNIFALFPIPTFIPGPSLFSILHYSIYGYASAPTT